MAEPSMSMGEGQPLKVCARCGVDCAAVGRVKDERGRYFCRACYERAISAMAARIVETAPGGGREAVLRAEELTPFGEGDGSGGVAGGAEKTAVSHARPWATAGARPVGTHPAGTQSAGTPSDLPRLGPADGDYSAPPSEARRGNLEDLDSKVTQEWVEGRPGAEPIGTEFYELARPDPVRMVPTKDCPGCGQEMRERDSLCPHCGFNTVLNLPAEEAPEPVVATIKGGKAHCGKCGYSLAGLKNVTCPECGTPNRIPHRGGWEEEDSREIARAQLIRPGAYLGVGLVGAIALAAVDKDLGLLAQMGVILAIQSAAAFGAFQLCSMLWIGFNQPAWLVAWKIAGIMALVVALSTFLGMGTVFTLIVVGTVLVYLISHELEVDLGDAWLVALATLVMNFGMTLGVDWVKRWLGW